MSFLPNLVAFQATGKGGDKYLANIDVKDPDINSYLAFSADDALHPQARFKIEPAEDGLVHIRSCFTNKLWSRSLYNEKWIVTSCGNKVEDKSKWACTLFKPNIKGNRITFTHVQLQKKLVLKTRGPHYCLYVDSQSQLTSNEPVKATIIDLTSLVKLPKYITFKAHNNKFLSPTCMDHETYEPGYGWSSACYEFVAFSNDSITLLDSLIEVLQNHDGSVRFRFVKSGKLWGVTSNDTKSWLMVENGDNRRFVEDPTRYHFIPTRVHTSAETTLVSLQSVYSSMYCSRGHQSKAHLDIVAATSSTIQNFEMFEVVELVSKRTIEVTSLRTQHAIILSDKYVTIDSKEVDEDQIVEFHGKEIETGVWSKSRVSWTSDSIFSIESPTPAFDTTSLIFSSSEKISSDDHFKWGAKHKGSTPLKKTVAVKVPHGSRTTAKLMARCVGFEIPFDYTQLDIIAPTGETKTYTNLQDGLYVGELCFDFKIETVNQKL